MEVFRLLSLLLRHQGSLTGRILCGDQLPLKLAAFEHWFGPYPFYEDGYKLVEAPYLGMEHQSSLTYGNGYANGYLGNDQSGSGDMYPKGGNMLHTLRQIINDDEKWRSILRELNKDFYHQVVNGSQIENYLSKATGRDLKPFFDQYLRDIRIPILEYYVKDNKLFFRWINCVPGFNMPVKIYISGKAMNLEPSARFTSIDPGVKNAVIVVDPNYYVGSLNMTGK